jgi:hypothetical protein
MEYLVCIVLLCCAGAFAKINQDDMRLISTIAEYNRANQQILNSFDCKYNYTFHFFNNVPFESRLDSQRKIEKNGRYAFSGEKVYSREDLVGSKVYLHYVRNETQERAASQENPRLVQYGTKDKAGLQPGTPNPWRNAGGYITPELDKLNPKYNKILSVEQSQLDGHEYIVVNIAQRLASSPENQYDTSLTIHFSVENGFLPVRFETKLYKKIPKKDSFSSVEKVTKIVQYQVQGSTLYLPVECNTETYRNGKLRKSRHYKIYEESVKINPELPDEIFRIDIKPGDQVIDKDIGMELANPYDLDFISAEAFDENIEDTDEMTLPQADTDINEEPNEPEIKNVPMIIKMPNEPSTVAQTKTITDRIWLVLTIFSIAFIFVIIGLKLSEAYRKRSS